MHCPKCGQAQISDETRFCSRCGFLLTGVYEVVANGGVLAKNSAISAAGASTSPRNRGLKQGLFIFLLSFLIVPIIAILTIAAGAEPYAVVISAILLGVGGLLRSLYALLFQSNVPAGTNQLAGTESAGYFQADMHAASLPGHQSVPASAYTSPAGNWRDTSDLQATPPSVTDSTTKLLQKEKEGQ